jgi:hypothetical protein
MEVARSAPIWPRSRRRWPGSGRDLAGSGRDLAGDDQDPASLSTGALLHHDEVAGLELRPDDQIPICFFEISIAFCFFF